MAEGKKQKKGKRETSTVDYLLRGTERSKWGEIKALAWRRGITIRDLISELLDNELKRERRGKEDK